MNYNALLRASPLTLYDILMARNFRAFCFEATAGQVLVSLTHQVVLEVRLRKVLTLALNCHSILEHAP